ncbi:MAG: hypothetical protein M3P18_14985 [Actinomycetota bacterium]|nr:hypothetical protein [Actinomycetota bacterium]
MKVFISSVRRGLEAERDALPGLLAALGHEPKRFEDYSAQIGSRQRHVWAWERIRIARPLAIATTAAIVLLAATSWVSHWDLVVDQWGNDLEFFVSVASRWLTSGDFYDPRQLAGPYEAAINVDTLYPPAALLLFLPFVWLPAVLWWAIPLGIVTWHVARCRPVWWVWPVLALILWYPRTQSIIVWGSTGMWIAAVVALGLRYRWPAALVMLKPTLAPFALIGVRSRWWWLVGVILFVVSVPMLADYLTAMSNEGGEFGTLDYSLQDVPTIAIGVIAWWARTTPVDKPVPRALL